MINSEETATLVEKSFSLGFDSSLMLATGFLDEIIKLLNDKNYVKEVFNEALTDLNSANTLAELDEAYALFYIFNLVVTKLLENTKTVLIAESKIIKTQILKDSAIT